MKGESYRTSLQHGQGATAVLHDRAGQVGAPAHHEAEPALLLPLAQEHRVRVEGHHHALDAHPFLDGPAPGIFMDEEHRRS